MLVSAMRQRQAEGVSGAVRDSKKNQQPLSPPPEPPADSGWGDKDRARDGDPEGGQRQDQGGKAGGVPDPAPDPSLAFPSQTPLFHAAHADRYARQGLIKQYEKRFGACRLVVLIDVLFPESVTFFEETIFDADPNEDLHLLLDTPGGDGETAVRLVRSAQARCRELTVIVPNQAKSAGTLLLMGAHCILMGPTSDLGPVDPAVPVADGVGPVFS